MSRFIGYLPNFDNSERYSTGTTTENLTARFVGGQAFTSTGTTGTLTTNFSLTGGYRDNVKENDVVIVAVSISADTLVAPNIVTSGYVPAATLYSDDGFDINLLVAYKVMGSTPDTSIAISHTGNINYGLAVAIHVWEGIDTTTPLDVAATTATGIDTAIPNPPAITPITNNSVILACAASGHNDAAELYSAAPATFSNLVTDGISESFDGMVGIASNTGAVALAEVDPGNFSIAFTDVNTYSWACVTLALRQGGTKTIPTFGNYKNSRLFTQRDVYETNLQQTVGPRVIDYAITATNGTNTTTEIELTVPNNVFPNDLIIVFAGNDSDTVTTQWDNTTYKPAGYTLIRQISTATADASAAAFYKVANGTEGGKSITIPAQSLQDMWAGCVIVRGANTADPVDVIGSNWDNVGTTAHVIPAVTTTGANRLVFFVLSADGAGNYPFAIAGTSWDDAKSVDVQAGTALTSVSGIMGWKTVTSAGTSNTVTVYYTQTSDGGAGFQFAIK